MAEELAQLDPREQIVQGTKFNSDYTVAEIEFVLQEVALQGGNYAAAIRVLNEATTRKWRQTTIKGWCEVTYKARYQQIFQEQLDDATRAMGVRAMELADKAHRVTSKLVDETEKRMPELKAGEVAPAARNISQVAAASVEKGQSLLGQPTSHVKVDSLPELVGELQELLGTKNEAVDGEAEEVHG